MGYNNEIDMTDGGDLFMGYRTTANVKFGASKAAINCSTGLITSVGGYTGTVTQGSYGSISVSGSSGTAWAGINFSDYYATLMVNATMQGFYLNNSTWKWRFDDGVLNVGTVPWSNVGSKPSLDFATHRAEGTNYIDYSRNVYNNGAYSGSGWVEPSDLGVRYAGTAGALSDGTSGWRLHVATTVANASPDNAAIEVRELNRGGALTGADSEAPSIGFHWGGRVYSHLVLRSDGTLAHMTATRGSYENFKANNYYTNGNYYCSDTNFGIFGNRARFDTVDSAYASDPLELCYGIGTGVIVGTGEGTKFLKAGQITASTGVYVGTSNTSLTQGVNYSLRTTTAYGYCEIGPQNGVYNHFNTSIAGGHYFDKKVAVDGDSYHYGNAWKLTTYGGGGGLVMRDKTNGLYYQLYMDGGVLYMVQV
jgi:hypothetical protein